MLRITEILNVEFLLYSSDVVIPFKIMIFRVLNNYLSVYSADNQLFIFPSCTKFILYKQTDAKIKWREIVMIPGNGLYASSRMINDYFGILNKCNDEIENQETD